MKPIRPQNLVHRGVVLAIAFYFPIPLLSEEEARQRVLALWVPGAIVYQVAGGILLRLPQPRRTVCENAPGIPLTLAGTFLTATPLRPQEIQALAPPDGVAVLVQGGIAVLQPLNTDRIVNPALWLDLHSYSVIPVEPLGEPPAPPRVVAEPVAFDARTRFQGIPKEDPKRQQILSELFDPSRGASSATSGERAGFTISLPGILSKFLSKLFPQAPSVSGSAPQRSTSSTTTRSNGTAPRTPPRPNLWDRLQRLKAQFLDATGLSRFVHQGQAEYLRRMMNLFERGELHEALRYAIPLKGESASDPRPPLLNVPTPRDEVRVSVLPNSGRSSSLNLSEGLYEDIQTLYRRAIQKLESEGRIEEAAFILADLLQEREEAVALLERHKRFELAAELAEGHTLPPGLIVRLWFLAGNTERAVQIARRTDTFADAVLRLERTDPERAKVLRGLWAQERARAGDYAGAVEVIWPLEVARSVALEWIRRAADSGGSVGGRMLARLLLLQENEETRQRAIDLLEETGYERAEERLAFAETLSTIPQTASSKPLARLAARSIWRDSSAGWSNITPANFKEILGTADDGALRTDVPPLRPVTRELLSQRSNGPLGVSVAANDTGALPIYDAAFLPNGNSLVALGEAGTRLISRAGRTIVHFDQPAHRLVISDSGNHAIGLAERGTVWRLSRFDLASRSSSFWQDAALHSFATDYDGSLWFVAIENDFLAIDATGKGFDALWRMPHLEGKILSIARSATDCSFLLRDVGKTDTYGRPTEPWTRWERWHYVLPSLTLRDRGEVTLFEAEEKPRDVTLSPSGMIGQIYRHHSPSRDSAPYLAFQKTARPGNTQDTTLAVPLDGDFSISSHLTEKWALTVTSEYNAFCCQLFAVSNRMSEASAQITVAGSARLATRLNEQTLTLADDSGRLLVLSLTDGTLLRNLRLQP